MLVGGFRRIGKEGCEFDGGRERIAREGKEGKEKYLVFIILRKAPMELSRVTMCARPVHASVTMMTGQENARNSSKDWKWCPHNRSYLPFPCNHVEKRERWGTYQGTKLRSRASDVTHVTDQHNQTIHCPLRLS